MQLQNDEVIKKELCDSYAYCKAITKASNFYNGIRLTEKSKRDAFYSMYTWLRVIDDIADNEKFSQRERILQLVSFHEKTKEVLHSISFDYTSLSREPFWLAFRDTVIRYQIPQFCLDDMFAGQQQDLVKGNYRNFNELYDYCYKVASTVGIISIQIWGYKNGDETLQLAEWVGICVQLTNILRDFSEDLTQRHRVYLPAEFVDVEELNEKTILELSQPRLLKGIERLIDKANEYYKKALPLYDKLHPDGQLSFLVMIYSYRALFEKIRKQPDLVLSNKKIELTKAEKIMLVITAYINHKILHHA